MSIQKTDKTTPSRYANQRTHYSEEVIYAILDEALFCTISYCVNNEPFAIPTSFVRKGDRIYIHGSVGSHFLRALPNGTSVCITVMLNYRSVVVFSKSEVIDDYEMKAEFFKRLTEKVVPGSWDYLRPMKKNEVDKTMLIAFDVKEASAKMRQGMPYSEESDETKLPIWSGLIPIPSKRLTPITDQFSDGIELPDHLLNI
jgi:nitroimidazol reductase NimA-like FMN-containing flavoprotein (pyridoxamine 5'-phosphate oxidase superfamily)